MMSKKDLVLNESQVAAALQRRRKRREDFFRGMREELQRGLKNAAGDGGMTTGIVIGSTGIVSGFDEEDELFVGSVVFVTEAVGRSYSLQKATIQSISETSAPNSRAVTVTVKFDNGAEKPNVPLSSLRSTIRSASSAASAVTALVRERQGLRNVAFADPQPVMEHFANLLANQVDSNLSEVNNTVAAFVREEASVLLLGSETDRVSDVAVVCVGLQQQGPRVRTN
jgi:hypothetical protein